MTTLKSSLVHRRHKCGPRERACSRTTDYGLILCTSQAGPWSHTLWHRQVLAHFIMTRVTPGWKKSVAGQVIQTCLVLQSSDYHSTNRHFWEAGPWTQRRPLPQYEPASGKGTRNRLGSSPASVRQQVHIKLCRLVPVFPCTSVVRPYGATHYDVLEKLGYQKLCR